MFGLRRVKAISVVILAVQLVMFNSLAISAKKQAPPKENPAPIVISSDTHWDSSQSPYIISGGLTVEENVMLTIGAGVVVKIHPGQNIIVDGNVSIVGEEGNRTVFTSINDGKYGGGGINGASDYWGTIIIGQNGSFDASYADFTYGNTIFNADGFLNLFAASVSNALNTGVQVSEGAAFCGLDSIIEKCSVGIDGAGEVYLSNTEIAWCTGSTNSGVSGVRPFAIEKTPLVYGQRVVLKEGSDYKNTGNYKIVSLGDRGSDEVRENILNGYSGKLKIGDEIYTEPGNKVGPVKESIQAIIGRCTRNPKCTFEDFEPDCPRIITIIMVESLDVNGRKLVKIAGFARFFIEDVKDEGGHTQIIGRYIGAPMEATSPGINISHTGSLYGTCVNINNCDKGINTKGYISMMGSDISDCIYGIYSETLAAPDLYENSFINNKLYGVYNSLPSDITLILDNNYWNSAEGPSVYDNETNKWIGDGDRISEGTVCTEWLMEKPVW